MVQPRRSLVRGTAAALVVLGVVVLAVLSAFSFSPLLAEAPPMVIAVGIAWLLGFLALGALAVLGLSRWRPR